MNKNYKDLSVFILVVLVYWLIIWMLPTTILFIMNNEHSKDTKVLYLLGSIFLTVLMVGSSAFYIGKNILENKKFKKK